MQPETWTWQLPPVGDEEGLEGYRVTDVWGRPVGSVRVLVRRGDDLYVVVRTRSPLSAADRPIPLGDVAFADHDRCVVGLMLSREQFAQRPPLPRGSAVHDGAAADAARVTAVPALPAATQVPIREPDSPFASVFFVSALGLLALLAIILFRTAPWDSWELSLFAIPVGLFLLALAVAHRGASRNSRPESATR